MNSKVLLTSLVFLLSSCVNQSQSFAKKVLSIEHENYVEVGSASYRSYTDYNHFSMYAFRNDDEISFVLESAKETLNTHGYVNIYLSSGETASSFNSGDYIYRLHYDGSFAIFDYSFNDIIDKNVYRYEMSENALKFTVPFSSIVEFNKDDVLGISFGEYVASIDSEIAMIFDEDIITNEKPTSYARINKNNKVFGCASNIENPKWISKAIRRQLLSGKDYSFAHLEYQSSCPGADDIHFSFDYVDGYINASFVGFGSFMNDEYIHMVLHNSCYNGGVWQLVDSDVTLIINKENAKVFNDCTSYWDYEDNLASESHIYEVNFYEESAYFTLDFSFPLLDISTIINAPYEAFKVVAFEHSKAMIYNSDVLNNMFYKGVAIGDGAIQENYPIMSLGVDQPSISSELKASLISDKPYSFANPVDVGFNEADDFYFSFSSDATKMSFEMVGFGVFNKHESISLMLHQGIDSTGWNILNNDYHFMITHNDISYKTNTTDFWTFTNVNQTVQTKTDITPTFIQHEGYFSFEFEIPYSLLTNMDMAKAISGYFIEFNNWTIYNNSPWINAMRYNGVACGDPSMTKSFVTIKEAI